MLPKNKSISALSNLNNISQLSGLPLNQLSNSLSSFHSLASNMQQFGQQLNNFSLNNLTQLTNASNLANLNSNLLLENLNLFNRSIDEREGCRSLICDNNGLIIGETTYRCMGCGKIHESIADIRQHFYEVHANSLLGNNVSNSNGTSVTDSTSGSSNNANNNSMAAAAAAAAALISSSNSHNNNNNSNNNNSNNNTNSTNNLLNSALNSNNHNQSNNQNNLNSFQSQSNNSNNNSTSNTNNSNSSSNNNNNNRNNNNNSNSNNNSSSGTQTPNNLTSLNGANSLKMAASSLLNGSLSGKDTNNNLNNSNSINNNLIGQLSPHNSLQALSVAQLSNSLQGALSAGNSNNSTSDLFSSLAGGASLLQPRKIKSEPQSQQQQQQIVAAKKRKIGDVVNKILNRNQTFLGSSTLFSDNQSVSNDVNQSPNHDQNIDQNDDLDDNDEIDDEPAMDFDPWSQMLANAGQLNALNKIKAFDTNLLSSLGRGIGANFDSNLDLGEGFSNSYFDFLQPKLEDISIKEESPRSIPSDLNLKRGCTTASVGKPGYIACAVCGVTRYYSCVYRRYGHFTCQVCYRFFRTFFSKPNKFGCAKLGECPLNVRVRCRACWIQACINTYTVDGQRKQILDLYKPIKSSNPNDSVSMCSMPQIGCEQQLTIGDPISSVADMKQDQLALHYSSLFNLGAVNLSNNRSSLNDVEDDDADQLEDESHGSLVMDEPEETNDAANLANVNDDSNQMNESSSPLNNKHSDSSPSPNDDSNELESDDLIRSCTINNEKAAISMLPGRQQLQRLLCQDLEKPLTAQDL